MKTKLLLIAALLVAPVYGCLTGNVTLSMEPAESHGKIITLPNSTGDWIPITTQEAKDVVKALEMLMPGFTRLSPESAGIILPEYARNTGLEKDYKTPEQIDRIQKDLA